MVILYLWGGLYQCLEHTKIEYYPQILKKKNYETSLSSILAAEGHCSVNPLAPMLVLQAVLIDISPWLC